MEDNQNSIKHKFAPHFLATVIAVWALDVITKIWAVRNLQEGVTESVIDSFFNYTLYYNTGGILGIFPDHPMIFQIMTGIAIILLIVFYIKTPSSNRIFHITIALIAGGALGNFTDRFFRKGVVDFLDVYIFSFRWPTFNVADAFISVGAVLLVYVFYQMEKEEKNRLAAENETVNEE
ncbi:MAG: signal peptidase II [Leptospirales bacterium]